MKLLAIPLFELYDNAARSVLAFALTGLLTSLMLSLQLWAPAFCYPALVVSVR